MLLVDSVADSVALGIERIVVCCFRGCVSVAHEKRYDLPLLLHIDDASLILFLPGSLDLACRLDVTACAPQQVGY